MNADCPIEAQPGGMMPPSRGPQQEKKGLPMCQTRGCQTRARPGQAVRGASRQDSPQGRATARKDPVTCKDRRAGLFLLTEACLTSRHHAGWGHSPHNPLTGSGRQPTRCSRGRCPHTCRLQARTSLSGQRDSKQCVTERRQA